MSNLRKLLFSACSTLSCTFHLIQLKSPLHTNMYIEAPLQIIRILGDRDCVLFTSLFVHYFKKLVLCSYNGQATILDTRNLYP